MPIARAALRVRSSVTPLAYGPRSLTVTITDFPVRGLVIISRVPNGRERCAAAKRRSGSNFSPLAVCLPSQ